MSQRDRQLLLGSNEPSLALILMEGIPIYVLACGGTRNKHDDERVARSLVVCAVIMLRPLVS